MNTFVGVVCLFVETSRFLEAHLKGSRWGRATTDGLCSSHFPKSTCAV